MTRILKLAALGLGAVALSGCVVVPAGYYHRGYYSDAAPGAAPPPPVAQAPQPAPVPAAPQAGVVTDIRVFQGGPAYTSGGGAVVGTVAGAIIGRQFGSGSAGRAVGTMIGAIGGAVVGNEIERQSTGAGRPPIYRVTVRLDNGAMRSYDYASLNNLRVGDRVREDGGQLYRE